MSAFLEGVFHDIIAWEASQARRGLINCEDRPRKIADDKLRALALLRSENQMIAVLVAAATSLANRATLPPHRGSFRMSKKFGLLFGIKLQAVTTALLTFLCEDEEFFELYQYVQIAKAKLEFASQITSAHDGVTGQSIGEGWLDEDMIADAWRRASLSVTDLLTSLIGIMDGQGVNVALPDEKRTLELLDAAACGQSPCIDQLGRLTLPGWAERRREARMPIRLPISVVVGIKSYPATIENLSSDGVQISLGFGLPVNSRLAVCPGDGRHLEAVVCWSEGGRAGLAFVNPLSAQDPLRSGPVASDDRSGAEI